MSALCWCCVSSEPGECGLVERTLGGRAVLPSGKPLTQRPRTHGSPPRTEEGKVSVLQPVGWIEDLTDVKLSTGVETVNHPLGISLKGGIASKLRLQDAMAFSPASLTLSVTDKKGETVGVTRLRGTADVPFCFMI